MAPVWLEDVDVVPAPFAPDPAGVFPIWTYVPGVWPATGDWGLAATRAPAAWNLLDNARATMRQDGQQDTVVFDAGFDTTHPDLNFASTESTAINQHGTHVSSTIGATYDNRRGTTSQGMSGINPVARLHGVQFDRSTATTVDEFETILGGKIAGGSYPTLRVINASFGLSLDADVWACTAANRTCGPGATDDTDPALATGPCLPSTDDTFIADLGATATVYADRVLGAAKIRDVVIVKSAGNSAADFCTVDATPTVVVACLDSEGAPKPGTTVAPMPAIATNQFVRARNRLVNQNQAVPLLVVGAVDSTGTPADFSRQVRTCLHPASASAAPPSPTIPPHPTMSAATPIRCKGPMGSGTANCPARRWPHRTSPVPSATCCS